MHDVPGTSDERFTVALYGIDTSPPAVKKLYSTVVQLFVDFHYPPDRLGYSTASRKCAVSEFGRINARLMRHGFHDIISFDVHAGRPNAIISGLDYFVGATFDRDDGHGFALISIPAWRRADPLWMAAVRCFIDTLKPRYGIGYTRPLRLGPKLYALGIIYGEGPVFEGVAEEEARNRSRWCDTGMPRQVYLHGVIRDVYRWNFLTESQLEAKIADMALREWINSAPARGSISRFADDVWLWEMEDEEIPSVRAALKGLIFNWRDYV